MSTPRHVDTACDLSLDTRHYIHNIQYPISKIQDGSTNALQVSHLFTYLPFQCFNVNCIVT